MRHALLAIVLVAASFAGGAVINGPGLRWAHTALMSRLGMDGEGDAAEPAAASEPIEEIPSRPIPPLVITPTTTPTPPATSTTKAPAPDDSRQAEAAAGTSRPAPADLPSTTSTSASTLPGLAPVPEGPSIPPVREQPQPPPIVLARAPATQNTETAGKTDTPGDQDRSQDTAIRRASLTNPGEIIPVEVPPLSLSPAEPSPSSSPSPAPAPSESDGSAGWAEVREAMKVLGVSRYGTEGEPGGRVRFHCVIPLAGRRAVSQHFEAEGDDDLQAARAALKRVALWKATEGDSNAP